MLVQDIPMLEVDPGIGRRKEEGESRLTRRASSSSHPSSL